jgi:hypothetical protein
MHIVRDRVSVGLLTAATVVTLVFTWLAHDSTSRRPDVFYLALVGAIQVVVMLAWIAMPRVPGRVLFAWGIVLIVIGFLTLVGPISHGAATRPGDQPIVNTPWAWIALTIAGLLTIAASVANARHRRVVQ